MCETRWFFTQTKQEIVLSQSIRFDTNKDFWKAIKVINKQDSSIPTPWDGDTSVTSNVAKAELLNSFFYKCLCKSSLLLSNLVPLDLESCPVSILCTEEQVLEMLCSLETSKSTGLDGVSTYMLRQTALFLVTGSFPSE